MTPRPPRLAERVLRLTTGRAYRDAELGDLREEFAGRCATDGLPRARQWYRRQVRHSLGPNLRRLLTGVAQARALEDSAGRAALGPFRGIGRDIRYACGGGFGIWKEFVYAARGLRRDRMAAAIAIVCLSAGMGATALLFSVADAIVFRPLPCPDPDQIVTVLERHPERGLMAVRPANFVDWQSRTQAFESATPELDVSVLSTDDHRHLRTRLVGPHFFDTWRVLPALGRPFSADDYKDVAAPEFFGERGGAVVISYGFWKSRFGGDLSAVGQSIRLDSGMYRVVGVMPASFAVIDKSDLWIPWIVDAVAATERRFHYFPVFARLRPGVSLEKAEAELSAIYQSLARQYPEDREWNITVTTPRQLLLGRTRDAMGMLLITVLLVLLMACANVSTILIARGIRRRSERALRVALGANRARLAVGEVAEAAIIAFVATAIALVIASVGIRAVSAVPAVADLSFAYSPAFDYRVFAFASAIAVGSVIGFGVASLWWQSAANPIDALKARRTAFSDVRRHASRAVLIVGEIAVGVVVVALTTLMTRSLLRLTRVDPGMRVDHLLTLRLEIDDGRYNGPGEGARLFDRILERLRSLPGVRAAAMSSYLPLTRPMESWHFDIVGRVEPASGREDSAIPSEVSNEFFSIVGIPIVKGRGFGPDDRSQSEPVAVISETADRRYFPAGDSLGRRIKISGMDQVFRIVGVAGDVYQTSLELDPAPALYVLQDQVDSRTTTLLVATDGDPSASVGMVRQIIHEIDPIQAIDDVRPMSSVYRSALAEPRFRTWSLVCFAVLSLVLAATGVFGVMSQVVVERLCEIGIKMALGATPASAVSSVVMQASVLVGFGIAAGTLASLAAARLVHGFLYGVGATDPASFVIATAVFVGTALVAALVPAYRATRLDVTRVLRIE